MQTIIDIAVSFWNLLGDSAPYILLGIFVGGLLKVFVNPTFVTRHLGKGRAASVFKAALIGVPMPLCSCGVLPAAASLKKQGANNGATAAFLISTPESGVDSFAVSYALLDPIMAIARPVAGAISALIAGLLENFTSKPEQIAAQNPDLSCQIDRCCDGVDCDEDEHANHHSLPQKMVAGMRYAFVDLWGDLAGWFFVGLLLAGVITSLVPTEFMSAYLGGGIESMLIMLVVGIPIYICATGSTPIAAALILQGVSPGAALVFLLAGPATNITSLAVVTKILGKKATIIYLSTIAITTVLFGLILDAIYAGFNISAQATVGEAGEMLPWQIKLAAAFILIAMSIKPLYLTIKKRFKKENHHHDHDHHIAKSEESAPEPKDCGCS